MKAEVFKNDGSHGKCQLRTFGRPATMRCCRVLQYILVALSPFIAIGCSNESPEVIEQDAVETGQKNGPNDNPTARVEERTVNNKALRSLEIGRTYDAFPDENHVSAEWVGKGKSAFDAKEKILSITTIAQAPPSYLMCRYKNAFKFEDYVLEFEYKTPQGMALFFRIKHGERKMSFGLRPASSFMKVKFVIKGIVGQVSVEGKLVWESVVDRHRGYFGFMAHKPGTVQIKNLKVTITK